ncbi:glycosyltransferase family 9 protein [Sphingomonas sp.]|uniref:glycosyltransferase family 9 protein n=1 Tax=Sphingomonas sp. TaxID=28214 RepID=UPI002D80FFD3|nr:glycosyltransferase family 9 protein [Sphingomonas sp.]HEU0044143.1 glycosyltransferase family 9 protein [Sphingomonas sp.]
MPDLARTWTDAMRGGDWERAWALSHRDLSKRDPATRDDPALPYHQRWVWDGRSFDGRDVLVRCYHGLGDTLQYARHLPTLAARAASLTVEAQQRLCGMLAQMECIDRLIPFDDAHPTKPFACDLEITELPFALREPPSRAPSPYLRATPADLPEGTIGLCYNAGDWDPARCVPPALLAPLCADRPVLTLVAEPSALPVLNPEGCPFDLDETAALVAGCALVITVDTMIAHLAGALGRPTWLLLKADPDWRWTPGARETAWYPTMRLYHQRYPGDWRSVIEEVADDLSARYPAIMAESTNP